MFTRYRLKTSSTGRTAPGSSFKVSRIIKRRTVANEVCDADRVSVNGRPVRASYDVKVGDIVEITMGENVTKFKVLMVTDTQSKDLAKQMYMIIKS